ncbi:MAG: sodium:solute symporter family protein [Planctomycetota bacterium]|nr:sodium:solute symporter family protein [Planctomycetota bacterium]MDA0920385.1 sodium:solute symporter family protein [Planctomycetota bacterium]
MLTFAAEDLPQLNPDSVGWLKVALCAYVIFLMAISIFASRKVENEADYLVAGRRLPLFLAFGTLIATWFGAATMFAAAGAARDEGLLGVILDPFACAATLVLSGLFFARPLWRMELFTMADFYRIKYGPRAEITGACIQVPSYFAWVALQYSALAGILNLYFEIPMTTGILIVAGVTLIYTMIGGMWSVTLTDTIQILLALAGLVVLTASALSHEGLGDGNPVRGLSVLIEKISTEHPDHLRLWPAPPEDGSTLTYVSSILGVLALWATGMFGNIPGQDLQQRVFAAKSEKTAQHACILAGVLYLCFGALPLILGLSSLVTHPEGNFDPVAFLAGEYLSTGMLVIFVIAVVSMIVSTATSAVLAPATILGHNLLNRTKLFRERALLRDRLSVLFVSLGGIALSLMGESLMGLLDMALSIQLTALFIPVVMGLYGKPRSQTSAVLAMLFGFFTWLLTYANELMQKSATTETFLTQLTLIPSDFYGLAASVSGYLIGQNLAGPAPEATSSQV